MMNFLWPQHEILGMTMKQASTISAADSKIKVRHFIGPFCWPTTNILLMMLAWSCYYLFFGFSLSDIWAQLLKSLMPLQTFNWMLLMMCGYWHHLIPHPCQPKQQKSPLWTALNKQKSPLKTALMRERERERGVRFSMVWKRLTGLTISTALPQNFWKLQFLRGKKSLENTNTNHIHERCPLRLWCHWMLVWHINTSISSQAHFCIHHEEGHIAISHITTCVLSWPCIFTRCCWLVHSFLQTTYVEFTDVRIHKAFLQWVVESSDPVKLSYVPCPQSLQPKEDGDLHGITQERSGEFKAPVWPSQVQGNSWWVLATVRNCQVCLISWKNSWKI